MGKKLKIVLGVLILCGAIFGGSLYIKDHGYEFVKFSPPVSDEIKEGDAASGKITGIGIIDNVINAIKGKPKDDKTKVQETEADKGVAAETGKTGETAAVKVNTEESQAGKSAGIKSTASEISKEVPRDVTKPEFVGEIASSEVLEIDALVSGKIFGLYTKTGRTVSKGETIILIDNRSEIKKAEAEWDKTLILVTEIKDKSKSVVEELHAAGQSFNAGEMDADAFRDVVKKLDHINEELDKAIRASKIAKNRYDFIKNNVYVRAPFDGKIENMRLAEKEEIKSGSKVCDLRGETFKYVEFEADPEQLSEIIIGKQVLVLTNKGDLNGVVVSMEPFKDGEEEKKHKVKAILEGAEGAPDGIPVGIWLVN